MTIAKIPVPGPDDILLWDPEEGPFSFRRAFGQKSRGLRYNEVREWRAMDVLSPSLALKKKGTEFPMTVKPDRKIALEDLFGILRDREPLVTLNANAPNTNTVTIKSPQSRPTPTSARYIGQTRGGAASSTGGPLNSRPPASPFHRRAAGSSGRDAGRRRSRAGSRT